MKLNDYIKLFNDINLTEIEVELYIAVDNNGNLVVTEYGPKTARIKFTLVENNND